MNTHRGEPALRDVFLHGVLAQQFGRRFRLAVSTPAESVRALSVQLRGFRTALGEGLYRVVTTHGRARRVYTADTLDVGSGPVPLHIVPVIAGAGGGPGLAVGLTVAGAALLAMAFAPAALGLGALGSTTIFGVSVHHGRPGRTCAWPAGYHHADCAQAETRRRQGG